MYISNSTEQKQEEFPKWVWTIKLLSNTVHIDTANAIDLSFCQHIIE